ncbi:hypothetical protein ACQXW1_03265 [Lactiplantibacillus pentosus]|jgi:hypothetical protein|uniref:hypothetical protein n=1 Tax=Lactiplantibacillus pentosus TaxID=1589 RepID=UPI0015982659|nr:hypothetical protein [Lactiplantibacillus pentosus]MCH4129398.1 hypothetical protein [Lactiplantibacillus sp.]MCT3292767.1 hypothetical protein [Lactiplantibacillus pentosus]BBM20620.1 hypothetical protein SN13T_0628 [Lactiplantibacillus plantarum]
MFDIAKIISKINVTNTIIPRIVKLFSIDDKIVLKPAKSARHAIDNDWRKAGKDMERGLVHYDSGLKRYAKINGLKKWR